MSEGRIGVVGLSPLLGRGCALALGARDESKRDLLDLGSAPACAASRSTFSVVGQPRASDGDATWWFGSDGVDVGRHLPQSKGILDLAGGLAVPGGTAFLVC